MQNLIFVLALSILVSPAAYAEKKHQRAPNQLGDVGSKSLSYSCHLEQNKKIRIEGSFNSESASITINDKDNFFNIEELDTKPIAFSRSLRKKEDQYAFQKYMSDYNAWQYIFVSIPKVIKSKNFKGVLTVHTDTGEYIAEAGEPHMLSCKKK